VTALDRSLDRAVRDPETNRAAAKRCGGDIRSLSD